MISASDDRKTLDSTVLFNAISTEATSTTTKSTKFFANLLSKLMKNKGFLHKFLAGIQKKGSDLGVFGWRKPEGGNAIFKSHVLIKIWKNFFYTYLESSLVVKRVKIDPEIHKTWRPLMTLHLERLPSNVRQDVPAATILYFFDVPPLLRLQRSHLDMKLVT